MDGLNILLVEDNNEFRDLIKSTLMLANHNVSIAASVYEAIDRVGKKSYDKSYDVIFIDVYLPLVKSGGMTHAKLGIFLAWMLKAYQNVPIIGVSNYIEDPLSKESLKVFDDFVDKKNKNIKFLSDDSEILKACNRVLRNK